jgi:hypothetical protein
MVAEGENGRRKLVCGTTKEKHKAKNLKTAGKVFYNRRPFTPAIFAAIFNTINILSICTLI